MGKLKDLGSLVGRVEIKLSKTDGLSVSVDGLAVILTVTLLDLLATIIGHSVHP